MRRDALAAIGIQLPVLPTIALGGLPGPPSWALRLEHLGLDVVASGASPDTPGTWAAAHDAVPHRPAKAVLGDADALAAVGCALLEGSGPAPSGCYVLGEGEALVAAVDGRDARVEDPDAVGALVLAALASAPASGIWVAATPGLDALPPDAVEAKLHALVEGARRIRMLLAKEQLER